MTDDSNRVAFILYYIPYISIELKRDSSSLKYINEKFDMISSYIFDKRKE